MNVIITGASKGIGKAIAEKFASNGHSLFLCARSQQDLSSLSETLSSAYPRIRVHTKACDMAVKKEVLDFAQWITDSGESLDVLVNNAGQFIPGNIYEEADGALEEMMKVNVYSAYYLSRALLPAMISRGSGHIFNICSVASLKAYPNGGSYSITKYALAGLSANLRHEMKPHGIRVTSVFPGAAYTASWEGSGVDPIRMMKAGDIAAMIYAAAELSPQACVEDIIMRPQLGDL